MKRLFTKFVLILFATLGTLVTQAQCDQVGYADLAGPCATTVCGYDSFCCSNSWDAVCAGEAASDPNCVYCWIGCHDNDLDGYTNCDGDCDDFDNTVNPGASDICGNGIDEDCNGTVDDGTCDAAGYTNLSSPCGISVCGYDSFCCSSGWDAICAGEASSDPNCQFCWCGCYDNDLDGFTNCDGDCDDFNNTINPGATELCSNGIDENCDGSIDNVTGSCDVSGYTDLAGACGTAVCAADNFCCTNSWDAICAAEATALPACSYCLCGCYDNDLDGYTNCDGDCNDFNDAVNPGEIEICNDLDDDCNGFIDDGLIFSDYYFDGDGDGYGTVYLGYLCSAPSTSSFFDGDCDDSNPSINPGAVEICGNGIDENCDSVVDNDANSCDASTYSDLASPCAASVCSYDSFCCSFGWDNICAGEAASDPNCQYCWCGCYDNDLDGYTNCDGDCDDFNIAVNPGATEICANDLDDDCDGLVDNVAGSCDASGYTDLGGACGTTVCGYDSFCCSLGWDAICAGEASSDAACQYCLCGCYDNDLDGYTNCDGDCDDFNFDVNPGMTEICANSTDDDCDGLVDNVAGSCDVVGYTDLGGTCGTAICAADAFCCSNSWDLICAGEAAAEPACQYCVCGCYDNDLDGFTNCDGDCDDFDFNVNPDASEICDNLIDDDCDGSVDIVAGACDQIGYSDLGGICGTTVCGYDSFCCSSGWDAICAGEAAAEPACQYCICGCYDNDLDGYTNCDGDCNDFDLMVNPGATEVCNGMDDDCDGLSDEGLIVVTYYMDMDGDGYGDMNMSMASCSPQIGYVTDDSDCDDMDFNVNPGAAEACNGIDDDCDGTIDDGAPGTDYYADNDGDGYGSTYLGSYCIAPANSASNDSDCNDFDSGINPGMAEICANGIDDDCDGGIDNAAGSCDVVGYADLGGACGTAVCAADAFCCSNSWDLICAGEAAAEPACQYCLCGCYDNDLDGYTNCDGDCDDFNSVVNPGAIEICDNLIDDDCDGSIDIVSGACDQAGYSDLGGICGTTVCGYDAFCCSNSWDLICAGEAAAEPACQYCICGCYDNDLDGYTNCDGDCNDFDMMVNPGATEVCNGMDDDCDGLSDEGLVVNTFYMDMDGDGYGDMNMSMTACSPPIGYVTDDSDCDDNDSNVNPAATEVCNNIDDDCDGSIDEGGLINFYVDMDSDGYGDASNSVQGCSPPLGYVTDDSDCDDTDDSIHPNAPESCNGIDDDCDGNVDNGVVYNDYYADQDGDGFGDAYLGNFCTVPSNSSLFDGDCDDTNDMIYPGAIEICDNNDNDCDGSIDEGLVVMTYYSDMDSDGYGDVVLGDFCIAPASSSTTGGDCDDTDNDVNPDATEFCNDIDDDCDGTIDDNIIYTDYYEDLDGDGFGDAFIGSLCVEPANSSTMDGDCNDADAAVNPVASEICNNEDDDCDGSVDEGLVLITYYVDADGDGYGSALIGDLCSPPAGASTNNEDCNDDDDAINPDASEFCNDIDDDCDGDVDESVVYLDYYSDNDGDGFGENMIGNFCVPPVNSSTEAGDCDDSDAAINPDATEVCNNADDNCNGQTDEGLATQNYYVDADGDGYGDALMGSFCSAPAFSSLVDGDCDDSDETIYPDASETCNNVDDNCDGNIDEFLLNTFYIDADDDGFGDVQGLVLACNEPSGYVDNAEDCDDDNAAVNPNAEEIANGIDDDCDGDIDNSVTEITLNWSVNLYPNPVKDQLYITVEGVVGSVDYIVYDAVGKVVFNSRLNSASSQNIIDCQTLAQGSYSLAITYQGSQVHKKFMKL